MSATHVPSMDATEQGKPIAPVIPNQTSKQVMKQVRGISVRVLAYNMVKMI